MTRRCTICDHPDRASIDQMLVDGRPIRAVAAHSGASASAVQRHKREHLPASLTKARDVAEVVNADSLLDRLRALNRETGDVLRVARESGEHDLRLRAIARAEKQIELEARLLGELQEGQSVTNVLILPEFVAAQTAILRALEAHPAARLAVAEALAALGPGDA